MRDEGIIIFTAIGILAGLQLSMHKQINQNTELLEMLYKGQVHVAARCYDLEK